MFATPINGVLFSGSLQLIGYCQTNNQFTPLDAYGASVYNGFIQAVKDERLELVPIDLANSVTTAIDQLIYMERKGLLERIKRF